MHPRNASVLPGVPLIESPFFDDHFDFERTDPLVFQAASQMHRQGYAIVDFPDANIQVVADRIIASLTPQFDLVSWQARGGDLRVQDAWRSNEDVRTIASNERILALLGELYGRQAFAFQTLNFPVGTQQHYHTDSVHFSSMPERFMCGVWVALEDIHVDAGPLIYYPGSHKWPIYVNEHIGHVHYPQIGTNQGVYEPLWRRLVDQHRARPERMLVRKGQALIWAANLLHGGERHRDRSRTRWSQVTHYYFEGCSYYTPMASDPALGSIMFREPVDIATEVVRRNLYSGEPVSPTFIERTDPRHRAALPSDFDADEYLRANPDVAAAGEAADRHYLKHGIMERRPLRRS